MNNISKKIKDVLKRKAMTATLVTASLAPGAVSAHNTSSMDTRKGNVNIETLVQNDIYGKNTYKRMRCAFRDSATVSNENITMYLEFDINGGDFICLQENGAKEAFLFDENGYFKFENGYDGTRKYSTMPEKAKKISTSSH